MRTLRSLRIGERPLRAHNNSLSVRHGPGDVSPVGHAASIHLDLTAHSFGIQEWAGINDTLQEVFPGSPVLKNGYVYANDKPGLGIDIDEKLAAKFPCDDSVTKWTQTRIPDGTYNNP